MKENSSHKQELSREDLYSQASSLIKKSVRIFKEDERFFEALGEVFFMDSTSQLEGFRRLRFKFGAFCIQVEYTRNSAEQALHELIIRRTSSKTVETVHLKTGCDLEGSAWGWVSYSLQERNVKGIGLTNTSEAFEEVNRFLESL